MFARRFSPMFLFVSALGNTFGIPAAAQVAADTSADAQALAIRRAVARHDQVRLYARGQIFELTNPGVNTVGLIVPGMDQAERHIRYAAIDRIDYRTSAWRKGLVVGTVAGGALSLIGAVVIASDDSHDANAAELIAATAVATAIYAAIGAAVGAPFKEWRTAYRRPPPTTTAVITVIPGGRLGAGLALKFVTGD